MGELWDFFSAHYGNQETTKSFSFNGNAKENFYHIVVTMIEYKKINLAQSGWRFFTMIPGNLQQFQASFRMVQSTLIGFPSPAALKSEIFPGVHLGEDPSIGRHCIIFGNVFIGDQFRCGNDVLIRSETALGDNVTLGDGACIDMDVVVGNNVTVSGDVWIPQFTRIENNVKIGSGVRLVGEPVFSRIKQKSARGIILGEGCVIGEKAVIAPGVAIGAGAHVDAGAVVSSDVPAARECVERP